MTSYLLGRVVPTIRSVGVINVSIYLVGSSGDDDLRRGYGLDNFLT